MKSKVYWTISPLINTPSVIYDNPIKPRTLAPCPVVNDHAQRTRIIPTPYDLKIKPNWFYNQVTEKYIFDGFDTSSKDLKIGMSVSNYGGKLAMEGVNTLVDIDLDENIFGNNDRIDKGIIKIVEKEIKVKL